jgi:hypothetical protein
MPQPRQQPIYKAETGGREAYRSYEYLRVILSTKLRGIPLLEAIERALLQG